MSRSDPQFNLRIPAEIKAQIEAAAHRAKRSATAEIIDRLQTTLDLDEFMAEIKAGTYAEVYEMLQSVLADNDRMTADGQQTFGAAYAMIDKLLTERMARLEELLTGAEHKKGR